MAIERRFIEIGTEAEGIDDRTKQIIKNWEKDGWRRTVTVPMGKNRRHMVFEKETMPEKPADQESRTSETPEPGPSRS